MKKISNGWTWLFGGALAAFAAGACGDDTGGSGGGNGEGGSTSSSGSTSDASSSTSASSSAASSTSTGPATCEIEDTAGLPCEVFRIIEANCQVCHNDPQENGAPFPLLTYDDTQAEYGARPIWDRMRDAIEPGAIPGMPFGDNPPGLAEEDLDVLRAWFETCEAGECARAE